MLSNNVSPSVMLMPTTGIAVVLYNNYRCCAYLVAGVSIPVIVSVVVIVVMVISMKIVIVALIIICSRRKSDRLSEWNSTCTSPLDL